MLYAYGCSDKYIHTRWHLTHVSNVIHTFMLRVDKHCAATRIGDAIYGHRSNADRRRFDPQSAHSRSRRWKCMYWRMLTFSVTIGWSVPPYYYQRQSLLSRKLLGNVLAAQNQVHTYNTYIYTYIHRTWYVFLRTPLLTSIYLFWQAASAIEEYQKILSTPEGDSGASEEGKWS